MQTTPKFTQILSNFGIDALNEMQETAYVTILAETDTLLLAPTGSGKTLAYLLPIFERLSAKKKFVQCLILVPSRELAIQIEQVWKTMSTGFKISACYGGHSIEIEENNLIEPPAVLVGTPGRIADHIRRRSFRAEATETLVLDEFDKSLSMGFHEEMSFIIGHAKALKKRVLVSATNSVEIPDFAGVGYAEVLDFLPEDSQLPNLTMKSVISPIPDKLETLFELLCHLGTESSLVFCNHRESAERICGLLANREYTAKFYHGGMEQKDRERALTDFRNKSLYCLVSTDLAARGLDIPEVKHVIHYHIPSKEDVFTHRNGRTARMFAEGTVYLILHSEEPLPSYISEAPEVLEFEASSEVPDSSEWVTIYISGGKKNKLSKGDIVGFFIQKGGIEKDDIGLIEVKDFQSFVAVKRDLAKPLLNKIHAEKLKNQRYKIEIAR